MSAESVLHFFMFYGAVFSVIIALGQFVQKKIVTINKIYAVSFFGLGVWLLQICIYSSGLFDSSGIGYYLSIASIPIIFIVPPLMVMRYTWIISSFFDIKKLYYIIFLPSVISLGYILVPILIKGISCGASCFPGLPILSDRFYDLSHYDKGLYLLFIIPNIYLITFMLPNLITMAYVWKKKKWHTVPGVSRMGYIFALSIVVSNVICVYGAFVSLQIVKWAVIIANVAMTFVYLVTQRHPDYNKLLKSEAMKARYERSRIKGLDVHQIIQRLYEIMEDEKAFADEELSLPDLAKELNISTHQLSEILNEHIQKNFNTFVNEFRVKEAQKLLLEEPNRSVLSIGVAVGFNSNTTFCTVFSKMTGMSPKQYRKEHSKK